MPTDLTLLDKRLWDVLDGNFFASCRYKNKGGYNSEWSDYVTFSKPRKPARITSPTFNEVIDITQNHIFEAEACPEATYASWCYLKNPKFDDPAEDFLFNVHSNIPSSGNATLTTLEYLSLAQPLNQPEGTKLWLCVENGWYDENGNHIKVTSDLVPFTITYKREARPNLIRPYQRVPANVKDGMYAQAVPPAYAGQDVTIKKAIWHVFKEYDCIEENRIAEITTLTDNTTIPESVFDWVPLTRDPMNRIILKASMQVETKNEVDGFIFWAISDIFNFEVNKYNY